MSILNSLILSKKGNDLQSVGPAKIEHAFRKESICKFKVGKTLLKVDNLTKNVDKILNKLIKMILHT